jgi:hypothetical protein
LEERCGIKRSPKAADEAFDSDVGYAEMKVTASDRGESASDSFSALEAKLTRAHQAAREKLISELSTKQFALEQQLREQQLQQQQRARQEQGELRAQLAQQGAKLDRLAALLDARSA